MAFFFFLVEKMVHKSGHSGRIYENLPVCRFVILDFGYLWCTLPQNDGDLFLLSLMGCNCLAKLGEVQKRKGRLNAVLFPVQLIRNLGVI